MYLPYHAGVAKCMLHIYLVATGHMVLVDIIVPDLLHKCIALANINACFMSVSWQPFWWS